jgi:hypothetical protein
MVFLKMRLNKNKLIAQGLLVLFLCCACDRKDAIDQVIVNLYTDMRVASVEYTDSTQARIARQNLLRDAQITSLEFRDKMQNIRANPELWTHFQEAVVKRLEALNRPDSLQLRVKVPK